MCTYAGKGREGGGERESPHEHFVLETWNVEPFGVCVCGGLCCYLTSYIKYKDTSTGAILLGSHISI